MRIVKLFVTALSLLFSITVFAAGPQVEIKTNLGNILLELYPARAPKTVENFLQYVKEGHYKSTVFHRVIPGFMIQGGGLDQALRQKPTRPPIENEAANGLKNTIGTIAMARTSDPHSASAQFFINVADNAFLNYSAPTDRGYGYTVFGKVTGGMEIVNKIAATPTGSGDVPRETIVIEEIRLISTAESAPAAGQPAK